MYPAFSNLRKAVYISTYWGDQNTGARRRYYSITESGKTAYAAYKQDWTEARELIDKLLK